MPNLMVRNNVIYGQIARLWGASSVSSFIINNTFLSNSGNVFRYDDPCYDITVRNNIFLFAATNYQTVTTLLFDHNIEVAVTAFPNGTNLVSQVPAFVAFPTLSAGFSYTADFHLTNPAQFGAGYGTDGTQVGVFGGIGQQFTYNQNGEAAIPIVRLLQVTNPVIQAGTPLNVNFITNVKQ